MTTRSRPRNNGIDAPGAVATVLRSVEGCGGHVGRTTISRNQTTVTVSGLWFGGWLFTIGYAHPHFWQIVLALLIWPYYVGDAVASR
jgi:hypothetical protein